MCKKNRFFLVLCFIAALLLGIIISATFYITGLLLGGGIIVYTWAVILFSMLFLLTYFSFSSFDIKESTILFLTLPISIIISIAAFIENYYLTSLFRSLQTSVQSEANNLLGSNSNVGNIMSIFNINSLPSIWMIIGIIVIIFNIFPLLAILFKPKQEFSMSESH